MQFQVLESHIFFMFDLLILLLLSLLLLLILLSLLFLAGRMVSGGPSLGLPSSFPHPPTCVAGTPRVPFLQLNASVC